MKKQTKGRPCRRPAASIPAVRWTNGEREIIQGFLADRIRDLSDRMAGVLRSDRATDKEWVEGYRFFSENLEKVIKWMILRLNEKRPGTGRLRPKGG